MSSAAFNDELPLERPQVPNVSPPRNDLLTVVETVYFHPADREIKSVDSRWDRNLSGFGEQPYERYLKANQHWQPLDTGWVVSAASIVIQNEEKKAGLTADDSTNLTIEICYDGAKDGDCLLIPPGESQRLYPKTARNLRIRCPSGTAKYHLFIVPG